MQEPLRTFVHTAAEVFRLDGPVYEFGFSPLDPPGLQPVRDCFPDAAYLGCEFALDAAMASADQIGPLPFPDCSAGTIVSLGLLDRLHEPEPMVAEFQRLLAPGGALLIGSSLVRITPRGKVRGMPPSALRELLAAWDVRLVAWQGPEEEPHSVFGLGLKRPVCEAALAATTVFLETFPQRLREPRLGTGLLADVRRWILRRLDAGHPPGPVPPHQAVQFLLDLSCAVDLAGGVATSPSLGTGSRLDLGN